MSVDLERLALALRDRYTVERELGEGGMAVVYLATDLKHDRRVAIKVLKPELAAVIGGDRFVAEIKTTAALQHPHILPLFESGEAGGFLYYVMPYVEGESLRDRLDRERQLPVDEAVRIAVAVASALHYAHERGVVHRDIKPANILLHAGQPVVADFGIALAISAAGGGRLTETGMSVGTPHYMSPEQASADREVDARSDVYSLACVLYEMLAGDPPHAGSSAQAVLVRILTEEPRDVDDARPSVPIHVRDALRKAMEKLPADRFASAAEFGAALENPAFRHGPTSGAAGGADASASRWRTVAVVAALLLLAVVAALGWWRPMGAPEVTRLTITLPPGQAVTSGPAVSPDGRTVAYTAGFASEPPRLYLRELDDFAAEEVPESLGAAWPFFSPDGRSVAFFARGRLFRWDRGGGPPRPLAEASTLPQGGTWGEDDTIVFVPVWRGGLYRISADGSPGDAELLRLPAADQAYYIGDPLWVPGRREIVYTANSGGEGGLAVRSLDLDTGESTVLQADASTGWVTPGGHLLFASGDLMSVQARPRAEGADGEVLARTVLTDVHRWIWTTKVWLGLSPSGTLVYVPTKMDQRTLVRVDPDGGQEPLSDIRDVYQAVRVAPGGTRLLANAFVTLWLHGDEGDRIPLIPETAFVPRGHGVWDRSGSRVFYSSIETGNSEIFVRTLGTGTSELVVEKEFEQQAVAVAPDGTLAFVETHPETGRDLWLAPTGAEPEPWQVTEASESGATISPDGRWIAYQSNATGRHEIWMGAFDAPGGARTQVTTEGGQDPVWSPSGDRLFYRRGSAVMAVDVVDPETSTLGAHRLVFDGGWAFPGPEASEPHTYDVMPDGESLVMIRYEPAAIPNRIHVVLNWSQELERVGGR